MKGGESIFYYFLSLNFISFHFAWVRCVCFFLPFVMDTIRAGEQCSCSIKCIAYKLKTTVHRINFRFSCFFIYFFVDVTKNVDLHEKYHIERVASEKPIQIFILRLEQLLWIDFERFGSII